MTVQHMGVYGEVLAAVSVLERESGGAEVSWETLTEAVPELVRPQVSSALSGLHRMGALHRAFTADGRLLGYRVTSFGAFMLEACEP